MNSEFKPCIVIPVYKHGKACAEVVDRLVQYNVPVILVDDGNEQETKDYLNQIKAKYDSLVELVTLLKNSGKGGAFTAGLFRAHELEFTHALQIDADGQHDTTKTPVFLEISKEKPEYLLCGYPEYDESVPGKRKNGRKFANVWCSIVTWKSGIVDSMCGFRVYPVEPTYNFLSRHHLDMRMGFDIEVLIKLIWTGLKFEFHPVKVTYPSDGISNFHMFRDNVRISWVFTKLCAGMLLRIPVFLWRKITRK